MNSTIPTISSDDFCDHLLSMNDHERIPLEGEWEITYKCNLKCIHCYLSPSNEKKELTCKECIQILDRLCEEGCLSLCFTGGEPFIRDDFIDIYTYAKEKGFLITLFTNGTLITSKIANHLKKYPPLGIEITVNGLDNDTYESITKTDDSFYDCMHGIELILDRRLPLTIKNIGMKENKNQILAIKKWALTLAKNVKFRFDSVIIPGLDGSKDVCSHRLSPDEITEIEYSDPHMREEWNVGCNVHTETDDHNCLYNKCGAGLESFHINPYGELQLCHLIKEPSINLLNHSFKYGFDKFTQIRSKKYRTDSKCIKCSISHLCRQCPGRALLENNDMEKPVEYFCRLAHKHAGMNGVIELSGRL